MLSQEVINVLKISKEKQYEYFIKKVADYEEIWSLKDNEGWATLGIEEKKFFPIWPKKQFAEIFACDEWNNYYPESIGLQEFLDSWLPGLKEDGIRVTIMWNNGSGIDVEWEGLKRDIINELDKY